VNFELHPNLLKKVFLIDLPLSKVLMEDEKNYIWLILVPKRPNISKIMDLNFEDQIQLLKELDIIQKMLWKNFNPAQLNVAAIGNKTNQLHIHVITRYLNDPAWPSTVWDHPTKCKYDERSKKLIISKLKQLLDKI
jgi:diadenosine tetraphosphate (Ap4A) HIT family hydrolase